MKQISLVLLVVLTALFYSCGTSDAQNYESGTLFKTQVLFPVQPRPEGQKDVIELRTEPIDTIRIGFVGLGMRGSGAIYRYTFLDGVKIVALCDVVPENVEKAQKGLSYKGLPLNQDVYDDAE